MHVCRYEGIKAHADAAAVNLNLWVTPDAANTDPDGGGLLVYRSRSSTFDFASYNSHHVGARELGLTESDVLARVPYRQNRAVLFSSSLFHATDRVTFTPGYETCRINYTLLFGQQETLWCKEEDEEGVSGTTEVRVEPMGVVG
jgi:hypothetical protein